MKIEAVAASFPDRVVTNTDVINLIQQQSEGAFTGDLSATLGQVEYYLNHIGNKERRWLDTNEPAFDHVKKSMDNAIAQADLQLKDVDLLIHSSVDRRVVEPGQSFFIAKAMGMTCQCFDVLEACNSWTRASNIAHALLKSGKYKKIMIVTTEFAVHEGEWGFNSFTLETPKDLDWAFGPYTMGEVATATILSDAGDDWTYQFKALPEYADLCMCPIDDWADNIKYMGNASIEGKGGKKFISYGKQLAEKGLPSVIQLLKECPVPISDIDIVFPHTHSEIFWTNVAEMTESDLPYYFIFPETGNLVSGSTPAAMALAFERGHLKRGDRAMGWIAAAGMSFALHTFEF